MSLDDYKLSAELLGHSLDVRALATTDDYIVSGSRDTTAKVWQCDGNAYYEQLTLANHSKFVSSVCILEHDNWICTGSNDATICVYVAGNSVPFTVLRGHLSTVSALAMGNEKGTLISGSWDQSAKVWKISENGQFTAPLKLEGHEAAVWSVCALASGKYVTGSADKTIIYWNNKGEKLKVLKGHKDCVRAILSLPNDSIISASNDASIRFWNDEGECVKELYGHSNYIYCMAFNSNLGENVLVSGGEDSTLRMWNIDGELGQPIALPAQSVWAVACLKNGDIVTGTSDGVVRIFTKDKNRIANETILSTFNAAVDARVRDSKKELGGYKVNQLPDESSLYNKGTVKGQTQMIRHADGQVRCYEWDGAKWERMGDVIGASGGTNQTSSKTLYEGKEYDFVFSVDIDDNAPQLKLPYNRGEDPWVAAQTFIHKNQLPQAYLDQVANFVIKNSGNAAVIETASSGSYQDPFTGGGRYIPGSGSDFNSSSGNVDPFTGASSYSTQSGSVPVNFVPRTTGQNLDPFTGASSHTTGSTTSASSAKHFPFSEYTAITTCDPAKVLSKLKEFNNIVDESLRVSDTDLEEVIKLAAGDFSSPGSVDAMKKLLLWPKENLFPVLDILRLAVCDSNICTELITPDVLNIVIQNVSIPPANQLMSIRILSNMLGHAYGRSLIENCLANVLVAVSTTKKGSANLQIAIATLLLNLTVVQMSNADQTQCQHITETIIDFLLWNADGEALYRTYRAIGNLLCSPHAPIISALLISTDQIMDAMRNNMNVQQQYGFEKINDIARAVINTL